jgi:hypothetical protein
MVQPTIELGRIAGELLDPLLWFLMFAVAVGSRRWVTIIPFAVGYVAWSTVMIALSEIGSGGWYVATETLWQRLAAALVCGAATRSILLVRRRLDRRLRRPAAVEPAAPPEAAEELRTGTK